VTTIKVPKASRPAGICGKLPPLTPTGDTGYVWNPMIPCRLTPKHKGQHLWVPVGYTAIEK
jgi:hypothetical protein